MNVWHVFPGLPAECRLDGFIHGNNQAALLVRTRLNDDSGPFMSTFLARKGVRCVHYRFRAQSKPFRGLGQNVLAFLFRDGSYVRVYYNLKPSSKRDFVGITSKLVWLRSRKLKDEVWESCQVGSNRSSPDEQHNR